MKLIESASLTHRPRSGSGAWRSLEKFGAVYPALYSDSGKMPAPTAGKFCNGLRSRRDVPRAGAGRVVAICCWFVSWKRCRGATLQNRTWPADKQIHMRRFLVALLIAVAAGTEDTVDQDDPTPAFAVVADGACEGWCNQCAHCGSPPAPPAKLASVRRLSVLLRQTRASRLPATPVRPARPWPRVPSAPRGVTTTLVGWGGSATAAWRASSCTSVMALAAFPGTDRLSQSYHL